MMGLKKEELLSLSKKWNTIYPAYIDSRLTESEGRRINKNYCVESPNVNEMSEVLLYLKMPHIIESDKIYSRDILNYGRIKVMIKNELKVFSNPSVKKKKDLLRTLGELIPKLKSRVNKQSTTSNIQEEPSKKNKKKKK